MDTAAHVPSKSVLAFRHRTFESVFAEYAKPVPIALALERSLECVIYMDYEFERPVLDVGCGDGIFAKTLFADAVDTGIDPDGSELEIARSLGAYLEVLECPGDNIPKPDGHYRTIYSNSVLEHIPDIRPVIPELHRLLDAEGQLLITVPTPKFTHFSFGNVILRAMGLTGLATRYQRFFNRVWGLHNVRTPDEWRALFEDVGFRLEESREYEPPGLALFKETLMPSSLPGLAAKLTLNRWVLFPSPVRAIITKPAVWLTRAFMRLHRPRDPGCLLFMRFGKAGPAR